MLSERANSICLLQILKEHSDENHILGMKEIISLMHIIYDIRIDRRTIYSLIALLKELGYDISDYAENGKGYYLRIREFELSEIRLLMDAVYSLQSIPPKQTAALIQKLQQLMSRHQRKAYRHLTVVRPEHKTQNQSMFLNIEILDEAISSCRKVSFVYLEYGLDIKLHPRRQETYIVNPYKMVCEGGRYYLICRMEGKPCISYYRIDLMQDISLMEENIDTRSEKSSSVNTANVPYAFTGKAEVILLKAEHHTLGNLIDRFGSDIKILSHDETSFTARIYAPAKGILFWALQYLPYTEILEPASLREEIIEVLKMNRYCLEIK